MPNPSLLSTRLSAWYGGNASLKHSSPPEAETTPTHGRGGVPKVFNGWLRRCRKETKRQQHPSLHIECPIRCSRHEKRRKEFKKVNGIARDDVHIHDGGPS